MKKSALVIVLLTAFIFNSCKKETATYTVGIDVQSSFEQDHVQALIDGQPLFDQQFQTNDLLGVCTPDGSFRSSKTAGSHQLKVIVNNIVTKTESFTLNKALYIGIRYNRQTNSLSFIYADQPFLYE